VRLKEGSSQYWISLLIDNHANRLTSVKIAGRSAQRESFNYWTVPSGAGRGPFKITVTDVYGRKATLSNIELAPGRTQRTSTHMGSVAQPVRTKPAKPKLTTPKLLAKKSATAKPSPSLSPSPSVSASSAAPVVESLVTSVAPVPSATEQTAVALSTSCRE
jgi:hypothetical protein